MLFLRLRKARNMAGRYQTLLLFLYLSVYVETLEFMEAVIQHMERPQNCDFF